MADKNIVKTKKADRRRRRVRAKINGSAAVPRLTVSKSAQNTFVQLIDDQKCATIASVATNVSAVKKKFKKNLSKVEAAKIKIKNFPCFSFISTRTDINGVASSDSHLNNLRGQ